jgi:ubiquinone/menaquinone biosynthesis C-methylase UbiE
MTIAVANETAKTYYDSTDADSFYSSIWGGEDIHIGIYLTPDETIREASRRTVERMASKVISGLTPSAHVLDLGSGYGGAARYLAKETGCHVTALNISEVENERNRKMNAEQGLEDRIDVITGRFESIPLPDKSIDIVWSQDAILHSGDRPVVLSEIHRVLMDTGQCIFTDPMQSDDCPTGVLQPILDRIHLDTLASPGYYRETAKAVGLREVSFEDLTHELIRHYERVLEETIRYESSPNPKVSKDYLEKMKKGLTYWIDGGKKGYLSWGIFVFRK